MTRFKSATTRKRVATLTLGVLYDKSLTWHFQKLSWPDFNDMLIFIYAIHKMSQNGLKSVTNFDDKKIALFNYCCMSSIDSFVK